jgi:hypothetical protein
MYALMYLGDPALQTELKLSADQVKKLDEQRDNIGGLFRLDAAQREETSKAIDKAFADILEPAQVKRLRQVVMQQLERGQIAVGAQVLAGTPEVADGLKLTDEQKAKITLSVRLTSLLTDDQKKAWKSLTGEPFESALQLRGFGGVFVSAAVPASVQYLDQKPVADELKLSESQSKKVTDLRDRWEKEVPSPVRTAEDRKKVEAMTASFEKEVVGLLDAGQNKRLKQIVLQQSLTNGREATVFSMPDPLKELKLTDGQDTKIKSIQEQRRKELMALFLTGEDSATIAKKVEAHKKETYAQLLAVLNDGQHAQLKELIGEPFKGQVRLVGGRGGRGSSTPATRAYLSTAMVLFAESKPLHEELKLSEVQIKQLAELRTKSLAKIRGIGPSVAGNEQADKLRAELAKDNEKALAEILRPQQLARFKQVILQFYAQGRPVPNAMLARFVEVSEGLALTKEQKDRLLQGEEPARVLDEKQQAKWKAMLGEPFAQVASLSMGSFGGPGGRVLNTQLQYLDEKSVREELKLADGQIRKLPELSQKWDELTRDVLNAPSGEEWARKMAQARASWDKEVAGVLNEKQVARLHQIELQQLRKSGLGTLLAEAEVRKGLDLSGDQIKKIAAIDEDARAARNLIFLELFRTADRRVDEDYARTLEGFNKIADGRLNAVLSQKQHDKLPAMLGEPFKGEITSGPFGGGFGVLGGGRPATPPATVPLGVQIATEEGKAGALIREVIENTPAAKAGLKNGDRIVEVAGKAVKDRSECLDLLRGFKAGEKVEIVVERDGKKQKLTYLAE